MRSTAHILFYLILMFTLSACDKPEVPAASTDKPVQKVEEVVDKTPKPAQAPPSGVVKVAKEGTNFDPPVSKDKIPQGVLFCDMGTVHYARHDKGDGQCPRCGMALVVKK